MRSSVLALRRARAFRKALSLPEAMLWVRLRGRGPRRPIFRRQHALGVYILDFYCPAACLAVEIDGAGHDQPDRIEHDRRRDIWLKQQGVRVLRVPAPRVLTDPDAAAERVQEIALQLIRRAEG